jgi:hypothetical protein
MSSNRSKTYSRQCRKKHHPNREVGIALISVLWVLLLLSALASAAASIARTNAILTHRALELAQAQAATDAAIVDTISRMSDGQVSRHLPVGSSRDWEFGGFKMAVSVSDEAGRIDVNTADRDLLLAFLYSQGVDENAAGVMLDQLRRGEPGTNSGKSADGSNYRPLQTVDELRRLPAWQTQHVDCWLDSLTVYTGLPGITAADATAKGLQALRWAKAHQSGGHDWIIDPNAASGAVFGRSMLGEVLRIVATSSGSTDVVATSEWVGRLTGDARKPILTMRWEHIRTEPRSACNGASAVGDLATAPSAG